METASEIVPTRAFYEMLKGRNEPGWARVIAFLDGAGGRLSTKVLPSLQETVNEAKWTVADLVCAIQAARLAGDETYDALMRLVEDVPGKFVGTRFVTWTLAKIDADISGDLKQAWGGIKQQMASTIEMARLRLLPTIPKQSLLESEDVVRWINNAGGIGKMHTDFMNYRKGEVEKERSRKEADRKAGQIERQTRDAERYFRQKPEARPQIEEPAPDEDDDEVIGAYRQKLIQAHIAAEAVEEKTKQDANLRSKFGQLLDLLVQNATVLEGDLPHNRLLLVREGKMYLLSEPDEFGLLSCKAATL